MTRIRGFTLTEVMFAVITLGIGLIMVAAVFPVAIQQTKLTSEEGIAASTAWQGMAQMTQLGSIQNMLPATGPSVAPYTGKVVRMPVVVSPAWTPLPPQSAWNAVRGNLISSADPRYAWVPLYRRDGDSGALNQSTWSSQAQIFLIPVAVRNTSTFSVADVNGGVSANLCPRAVNVTITDGTPDIIQFTGSTAAVAEGTFVIIADDKLVGANAGRMNGRIYRVGNLFDAATDRWELLPGNDFVADAGADGIPGNGDDITGLTNADAFIVGRGFTDPAAPGTFSGPAMDVAVYTGFVYVK
jgi:hypothetical protein